MLGDGCLYQHKKTHAARLTITRARRDRNYAEWTYHEFLPFSLPLVDRDVFDIRTQRIYQQTAYVTRRSHLFTAERTRWYTGRKKIIPSTIALTPLVLAVWFADDGHVRPNTKAYRRLQLKLSTMDFTKDEVERLATMLSERFDANFHPVRDNNRFNLTTADRGCQAFFAEIDSYLPPGMERKAIWRQPRPPV